MMAYVMVIATYDFCTNIQIYSGHKTDTSGKISSAEWEGLRRDVNEKDFTTNASQDAS